MWFLVSYRPLAHAGLHTLEGSATRMGALPSTRRGSVGSKTRAPYRIMAANLVNEDLWEKVILQAGPCSPVMVMEGGILERRGRVSCPRSSSTRRIGLRR